MSFAWCSSPGVDVGERNAGEEWRRWGDAEGGDGGGTEVDWGKGKGKGRGETAQSPS